MIAQILLFNNEHNVVVSKQNKSKVDEIKAIVTSICNFQQ